MNTATRAPTNKWIVTLSVTFGTLMGTIDASIVNVALPHIRGSVGATLDEITWITVGFVIASVIVMPLTGFLGRQFGQKRVYLAALGIFIIGSALCGLARSLETLVLFRVVQGLGAGALQPTEQAILRQTFPPEEQGMAMALFGMAIVAGPAAGPTLGGYIVDQYSWPWIFFINLPVGLLGIVMVTTFVREDPDIRQANRSLAERQRRSLDWLGIVLLCVGLSTLEYVLEEGARDDWFESATICGCLAISLVTLAAFVVRELTAPAPAVDLRLFKDQSFLSASLIGAVQFAMLMANMFLLPVFMQELLGYTALQSGLVMLPRAAVMLIMNPIVGSLYGKISARLVVGNGIVWVAAGSFLMSRFTLDTGDGAIIVGIIIQGIGFSCLFAPLTAAALTNIPKHRLTDATGLNSLLRQMGGSTGLAVFATLLTRFGTQAKSAVATHVTELRPEVYDRYSQLTQGFVSQGFDLASAHPAALQVLTGQAIRQGMILSFRKDFFLAGLVFLCVLPLLVFLKGHRFNRPSPAPVRSE